MLRSSGAAICLVAAAGFALAQAPTTIDQQRALMLEFLTQREQGFRSRWTATGWREETTRMDGKVEVRSVIEVACPDGYHMRVTRGSEVTEFYSVAGMEYRLRGGKWVSQPAPTGHYNGCYDPSDVRRWRNEAPPEALAQQWVDDFNSRNQVEKGPVRTIRGERCQEWKMTDIPRPDRPANDNQGGETYCLSLADGHMVQTDAMTGAGPTPIVTTIYDWNKPIVLKAPTDPAPPTTAGPVRRRRR